MNNKRRGQAAWAALAGMIGGLLVVMALAGSGAPAQAQGSRMSLAFNAKLLTQQVVDMDIDGTLDLSTGPAGEVSGTFTFEDGTVAAVVGSTSGVAISLALTLGGDRYLFAT